MFYPFSQPNGDEEPLNQQFSGYLYYSLQVGPELVNSLHEDLDISFSKKAKIVAHQKSPLPRYTETGTNREIDWVIADENKIVGYESKYGASLSSDQLQDELEKLELNAEGRDVSLITVTTHIDRPSLIDQFENDSVYWASWSNISKHLYQIKDENIRSKQIPIVKMLQDLFDVENIHPEEDDTEERPEDLPDDVPAKATITTKEIDDKLYRYWQWREGDKIKSKYKEPVDPDE